MRYQTEAVGETTWLLGELPSGGAVTITLYKLSDSSTPALDSNACTEIGATGIYKWATTNITTPETVKTEYLYVMTDGTLNYFGKIVVGGYVDKINANISTRSSHAATDIWSVGTRALTDKVGFGLSTAGILAIWHQLTANIVTANTIGKLLKDDIDAKISLVKSQTDKMNFAGTDIKATLDGEKVALSDATEGQIDNIETDLNTPNQYKADVSALATLAALTTHDTEVKAEVNANEVKIDALQVDLNNPDQYKADVSALALEDGGRLQNAEADTNEMQGKLPTNNIMGSSVKTDKDDEINAIKTETDKIQPEIIDKKDQYKATGFAKPGDVKCGGGGGGAIIERPDIWKLEEKLKLIEDIKKIYKMINELGSLQSVGLQNVKKNIEDFKNSLLKLIKEEVILLVALKKTISDQPQTDSSDALADSVNQLITKWDSIQKSILKSSDLSSLDNKLDDLSKIMAKSLSNKDLEELINAE